jgi:uncharacterized protein YjbI with pentapeptide repeats
VEEVGAVADLVLEMLEETRYAMVNPEHVKILKQGSEAWNKWFRRKLSSGLPDLSEADLSDTDLSGCDLRGVTLKKAILIRANLSHADLRGANLSESFLFRANLQEAEANGASLNAADISEANLEGIVLNNSYLIGAILTKSNLERAQLSASDLKGADLRGADLREANLSRANLSGADLSSADLREANLCGADLERTNLGKASLSGTNFSSVHLYSTIFGSNDLSGVVDLEKADHHGPSILNIETIYKSGGKLPEGFLRGCGLSELQIQTAKLAAPGLDPQQVSDITGRIQQFYLDGGLRSLSCFISYNSRDEKFARRLHDDLQTHGIRAWLAPEDLKTGDKFRNHMDGAIRASDKLLIVFSINSIFSSWIEKEVKAVLEMEHKENHHVLLPLRLDDEILNAEQLWAEEIRNTRQIGDFSDESKYQKAFDQLLEDLKARIKE